jgi:hypothetical protein
MSSASESKVVEPLVEDIQQEVAVSSLDTEDDKVGIVSSDGQMFYVPRSSLPLSPYLESAFEDKNAKSINLNVYKVNKFGENPPTNSDCLSGKYVKHLATFLNLNGSEYKSKTPEAPLKSDKFSDAFPEKKDLDFMTTMYEELMADGGIYSVYVMVETLNYFSCQVMLQMLAGAWLGCLTKQQGDKANDFFDPKKLAPPMPEEKDEDDDDDDSDEEEKKPTS